ncbi:MAG: OsmC family protein [Nitrospira sp.]|nr:OsmC family protein [Nitrospira sp.]MDH4243624.1 OsmC family protein [Nitrospira sp.]MDH4355151.1 OsmC family protein [Nitrospira sp.]MDH5317552.1 OsmC family protein [Nitrospira sp.]
MVDKSEMKLTATFHGGTRYDIVSGQHRVITDQPAEDGGRDAGMSPVELFVGSVASCIAYFVGQFCGRHGIDRDGLSVDAEWGMAERPHRVGRIDIEIHVPHRVTAEQRERLLKVAHACTVHQAIAVTPIITIQLNPHTHQKSNRSEGMPQR